MKNSPYLNKDRDIHSLHDLMREYEQRKREGVARPRLTPTEAPTPDQTPTTVPGHQPPTKIRKAS